jgi:hypothetical protein
MGRFTPYQKTHFHSNASLHMSTYDLALSPIEQPAYLKYVPTSLPNKKNRCI